MRIEEINEQVEVIALFSTGRLSPLKFRWRERVYKVEQINGHWGETEGTTRFHHFAVLAGGAEIYDLCYNERAHDWKIERVSLPG